MCVCGGGAVRGEGYFVNSALGRDYGDPVWSYFFPTFLTSGQGGGGEGVMENKNIAWIEQSFGLQGGTCKSLISSLEKSSQQHIQRQQQEGSSWLCYKLKARLTCFVSECVYVRFLRRGRGREGERVCLWEKHLEHMLFFFFFLPPEQHTSWCSRKWPTDNLWSSGLNAVFWLHACG